MRTPSKQAAPRTGNGGGGGARKGGATPPPPPPPPRDALATRRAPWVPQSPPLPPTPETPAKPIWWDDEEDDERAAELLFTLFAGDVGAGLQKDIEDWVLRETAVAAEAFPGQPFWRGLDIRWIRHSYARGGIGDALRRLKQRFARGEGKLKYVAVDGGRQKRSRRAAEASDKQDEAHPVGSLRSQVSIT